MQYISSEGKRGLPISPKGLAFRCCRCNSLPASPRSSWLALLSAETLVIGIVASRIDRFGRNAMTPTTNLIATSREAVARTRARLDETRTIIAVNRRLLNPWWSLSGGSDYDVDGTLLQSVLDRLHRGVRILAPSKVWAGRGTGRTCIVCTRTTAPEQVENEIAIYGGGVTVRLWAHLSCFNVWRHASEVYAQQHPTSADSQFG